MGRWSRARGVSPRGGAPVAVLVAATAVLAACGSSTSHPSAAGTPLQQSCAAVTAVLGNGPDASEDPIGYAEAQILPLRSVTTGDSTLRRAVLDLSTAYKTYFATHGSAAARTDVRQASARVDAVCPGATS